MRPLAALILLALPVLAQEGPMDLPVRCNASACAMPRDLLIALLDSHNFHVKAIKDMEAQGCKVPEEPMKQEQKPPLKKERDL